MVIPRPLLPPTHNIYIYLLLKNQPISKNKYMKNLCRKTLNDQCQILLVAAIHSVNKTSLLFKCVPITCLLSIKPFHRVPLFHLTRVSLLYAHMAETINIESF